MLESRCLRLLISEPSVPGNQGVKTLQVLRPPFLLDRSLRSIQSISHSEITCPIHVLSDKYKPLLYNQGGANVVNTTHHPGVIKGGTPAHLRHHTRPVKAVRRAVCTVHFTLPSAQGTKSFSTPGCLSSPTISHLRPLSYRGCSCVDSQAVGWHPATSSFSHTNHHGAFSGWVGLWCDDVD